MDFGTYKTTTEVIKEGIFWGKHFRDIYSGVNGNWYRKSLYGLKDIDSVYYSFSYYYYYYYCYYYYYLKINKYGGKRKHH